MSTSQYSKIPDSEAQAAYAGSDAPPEYPPRPTEPTGLTTTYRFNPRYPVPGSEENAQAKLYASRQETLNLVRDAFPILNDYPDERIEFFVINNERWCKILSSTFENIAEMKPTIIKVQVADGPGDRSRRQVRTAVITFAVIFAIMFSCGLFGAGVGAIMTGGKPPLSSNGN